VGWIVGGTTTTTQRHATTITTRPQPREQLLVGWNAGGTTITQGKTASLGRNAGPNDANVVWALGNFFFVRFFCFTTNQLFFFIF
jgi:hypothetical protein